MCYVLCVDGDGVAGWGCFMGKRGLTVKGGKGGKGRGAREGGKTCDNPRGKDESN